MRDFEFIPTSKTVTKCVLLIVLNSRDSGVCNVSMNIRDVFTKRNTPGHDVARYGGNNYMHGRMPSLGQLISVQSGKLSNSQTACWMRYSNLYDHEGTDRADLLRDMVTVLVSEIQTSLAKLLTLLHMVGHYLPQPYPVSNVTSQTRTLGRGYARDIIDD